MGLGGKITEVKCHFHVHRLHHVRGIHRQKRLLAAEADLGPRQKRVCQAPSSVNPFLPCRAALFGKQPLTSKGCGVGLSGSAARGPPRLRPVARRESRGHQAVGAGERAARSLGRPAVDLPDASSPAFIRSSAAVCLVAVPLRLRSARCAPPRRRESSRRLSAGEAAGRGSGHREGRSGGGSGTRALRLRRHRLSPPAVTCAPRSFSFRTDVFLPRKRCRLHADTSRGPRWEGSPLTPASIYSARTPCFRPQPFQVTVWGRSCRFATPGSRSCWQFGKGSQPLPGRARAKLPERAPARRAGGLRRAFTPACPRGAASREQKAPLLQGPGRAAQDGSAPRAK